MQDSNKIRIEHIVLFVLSFMCALMLTMTFAKTGDAEYQNRLAEVFDNLRLSCSDRSVISTVVLVFFYVLGKKRFDRELPRRSVFVVFSAFIALIWLMAESLRIDNLLYHIIESDGQIVKSVIYLLGASYFIYEIIAVFHHVLNREYISWGGV